MRRHGNSIADTVTCSLGAQPLRRRRGVGLPARIFLSPASAAFGVGDTFKLSIEVDTENQAVRGGAITLLYDESVFEVVKVEKDQTSPFNLTPAPAFGKGRVEICFVKSDFSLAAFEGTIATLTVRAIHPTESSTWAYESNGTRFSPDASETLRTGARYSVYQQPKTSARDWPVYK